MVLVMWSYANYLGDYYHKTLLFVKDLFFLKVLLMLSLSPLIRFHPQGLMMCLWHTEHTEMPLILIKQGEIKPFLWFLLPPVTDTWNTGQAHCKVGCRMVCSSLSSHCDKSLCTLFRQLSEFEAWAFGYSTWRENVLCLLAGVLSARKGFSTRLHPSPPL